MALQKTGVILTAENEAGFLRAMDRSRGAVKGFEAGVEGARAPMQGISMLGLTAANVIGNILFSALSAGASGFMNLAKSAVGVVAANERMSATFESMIAKELRAADATLDMGAALDAASPRARELLKWIEALVIKSPFERQGIVAALQTAVAYGFVTQGAKDLADAQEKGIITAQRLAEAEVNWAAATGKTSFEIQRATLALGQMSAKGKVTGEELRQLREAGVDVQGPLKALGYTIEDVSAGLVSADEFILKLVETMENDFGAAAERQAGTLTGLMSSIGDLSQTYLREFFGPLNEQTGKLGGVLGAVQPYLQKFVDLLTQPKVVKGIQTIGLLLGDTLSTGLERAGGMAAQFATQFAAPIIQTAENAFSWGANIAIQLASGLIEGASSAIIGAINFISGMLANWFAPGSPPKVAPKLPIWGKAAMTEWLEGFSSADFGSLKALQGPIQGALQAMVGAGIIDSKKSANSYRKITEQIAKTLAEGGDPEALFKLIENKTGDFGVELAELARKQFDVAAATKAVEQAEKDLIAAREAEFAAGKKISDLTSEYNNMLRGGASQKALDAKLAEINAQETALDVAKDQGAAAGDAYAAAKENLDVLQEQLKLQQELVQVLIDLAKAQNAATAPDAPTGGGGGTPPAPPDTPIPPLDTSGIEEAFDDMLDRIKQSIIDKLRNAFQPLVDAFRNAIAGIQAAWATLLGLFTSSGLADTLANIWNNLIALTKIFISIIQEFVAGGLRMLFELWIKHRAQVERIWIQFWNLVQSIAGGIMGLIVSNVDQRLQELRDFFEERRGQISEIIDLFWENMQRAFDVGLQAILTFTEERLTSMQTLWDTNGILILESVDNLWDNISKTFFEILGILTDFVHEKLLVVQAWWEEHGANVELVINRFLLTIGGLFDLFLLYISTGVLFWTTFLANLWAQHGDEVKALVQLFLDAIGAIFDAVLGLIGASFDTWAALFKGDWEGFLQGIQDYWGSIWDGIGNFLEASLLSILTAVGLFIGVIVTFFTDLYHQLIGGSIIPEMLDAISNYFETTFKYIEAVIFLWINTLKTNIELLKLWWGETWDDIRQKITDVWDGIVTKVTERVQIIYDTVTGEIDKISNAISSKASQLFQAGKDLMGGLINGIVSSVSDVVNAIKKAVESAIAKAKALLGIQSPSKVFMEIGKQTVSGMTQGIEKSKKEPEKQMSRIATGLSATMQQVISPPAVSQLQTQNTYNNTLEANFNNTLGNNLDLTQLDDHIMSVITRAFDSR